MFDQAQQARATAENGVIDLISEEFQGVAFDEVLALAIEIAIDEFDAEQDSEGWTDCTNYAACAARAQEQWLDAQQEAYVTMMDDKAHALADQRAGL
jgi:hypothetical protein